MRNLKIDELLLVSGGTDGSTSYEPTGLEDLWSGCEGAKQKNNNGYGNGAEAGPPPGSSGDHNPQLLDLNLGPRGVR